MKKRNLNLLLLVISLILYIKMPVSAELFRQVDWVRGQESKISFAHIISENNFILWTTAGNDRFFLSNPASVVWRSKIPSHTVNIAVLSPDVSKQKLALGFSDGDISLLEVSNVLNNNRSWLNNIPLLKLTDKTPVTALAFSPDKHTLASGTQSGSIVLWDTNQKKQFLELPKQDSAVITVAFSPDGRSLASGTENGSVRLLNLLDKKDLLPPIKYSGKVNMVGFSPDGDLMATASDDRYIRIWNIAEQKELTQLPEHTGFVKVIAFSPDGKHLASGDEFGKVYLWKVSNGEKIDPVKKYKDLGNDDIKPAHRTEILSMAFSKNGVNLISECREKLLIWDLNKVGINPDPKDLINKPTPNYSLITHLKENDNEPPMIIVSEEVKNKKSVPSETDSIEVTVSVSDKLNEVKSVIINDIEAEIEKNGEEFEFTAIIPLNEGENPITVTATDTKNNTTDPEEFFTINRESIPDENPPTITSIEGFERLSEDTFEGNITQDDEIFEIKGTVDDNKSGVANIKVGGKMANLNGDEFNVTVKLKEGNNQIRVIATDHDKNDKEVTLNIHRKMTKDKEKPVISIKSHDIRNNNRIEIPIGTGEITVSGTVRDNRSSPQDISVKINNNPINVDSDSGEFSKSIKIHSGDTVIKVQATDEENNNSNVIFTAVLPKDTSRPTPPIDPKTPTDIKIIFNAPSSYTMKGTGKQETVPHLRRPEKQKLYCKIGGVVLGLENPKNYFYQVTIREKSSGEHRDPIGRMLTEDGTFNFDDTSDSLKLFNGLNEIEVIIKFGSEKISRRFYVERIQDTEPHIDPPRPSDIKNPKTDNQPFRIKTIEVEGVILVGENSNNDNDKNGHKIEGLSNKSPKKITVTTNHYLGHINIIGFTEGPGQRSGKVFYKTEHSETTNPIEDYAPNQSQFDLKQHRLKYGDNTITFVADPNDGYSEVFETTLIIHRKHEREGKDYAILFAVQDYEEDNSESEVEREFKATEWENLDAPIPDAVALEKRLKDDYGFEMILEIQKNPTKDKITEVLDLLVDWKFESKDQLFIFFAGHGYVIDKTKIGYFIPKPIEGKPILNIDPHGDVTDKRKVETSIRDYALSHDDIHGYIEGIGCDNILVVMDTCKSGKFKPNIKYRNAYKPFDDKELKEKIEKRAIQFLTSGTGEQDVADMIEGKENSPFVYKLLEALDPENSNDGIVTFEKLTTDYFRKDKFEEFLEDHGFSPDSQTPQAGTLKGHQTGGDFVFWGK